MPEMIVIASLPRSFTTTGRPLLVGAAAAQITVAYAGKVGEAATQTLLMQVLKNTSNPTSQHRCTPIMALQISHEHVVVQTGTKPSQQILTPPPPLSDILPMFYSVKGSSRGLARDFTTNDGDTLVQHSSATQANNTKKHLQSSPLIAGQ